MDKKVKQWRRLYTFACKTCKRTRAQTIRWKICQAGRCRVCRGSAKVSENQLELFGMPVVVDPNMEGKDWKIEPAAMFAKPSDSLGVLPVGASFTT